MSVAAQRRDGAIDIEYRVGAPRAVQLNLAFADDSTQTHVPRGENADRVLRHRHVVRAFRSVRVAGDATGSLSVPWQSNGASARVFVVAYASDPATLAVMGADARFVPVGH